MTEKRFSTNGYYIYDHFKEDKWLVNEVEVKYIVTKMNNLDIKARERSKALSKLQKENEQLKQILNELSDMLQFDVENGIRSYPVKLSEYLSNALKELQMND